MQPTYDDLQNMYDGPIPREFLPQPKIQPYHEKELLKGRRNCRAWIDELRKVKAGHYASHVSPASIAANEQWVRHSFAVYRAALRNFREWGK